MRYDRANLFSTLRAAYKTSAGTTRYVFATAYGYTIDKRPPDMQAYYEVNRDQVAFIDEGICKFMDAEHLGMLAA